VRAGLRLFFALFRTAVRTLLRKFFKMVFFFDHNLSQFRPCTTVHSFVGSPGRPGASFSGELPQGKNHPLGRGG